MKTTSAATHKAKANRTKVSFRIFGDSVIPGKISMKLALQPTLAHAIGDRYPKHPDRKYNSGLWSLDSSLPAERDLSEHLQSLLSILDKKEKEIRWLKRQGFSIDFFCGCFVSKESESVLYVDPGLMLRIAKLNASIEIHIYPVR